MAQIVVFGRVMHELVPKEGQSKQQYVCFDLMESSGNTPPDYYQVWARGDDVIKTNYLFICPGLKNAAGKVTQGMTRPLLRHSKKQPKSAKRQQKRNPEKGAQNHEDQIISQGLVRSGLA